MAESGHYDVQIHGTWSNYCWRWCFSLLRMEGGGKKDENQNHRPVYQTDLNLLVQLFCTQSVDRSLRFDERKWSLKKDEAGVG
jgi:hypothetical protein